VVRPDILNRHRNSSVPAIVMMMAIALSCPVLAQQELDQQQAETRLEQVTRAIGELRQQLDSSRKDYRDEQARIKAVDLAIQEASVAFRELERQRQLHLDELAGLENRKQQYLASLDDRMGQLAEQVRSAYRLGNQSRVKLVLNQDDPVRLGRMLAYYDYLSRAQAGKIAELKRTLATLDEMQLSIDRELSRVESVQNKQLEVMEELARQRESRELLLSELSSQIDSTQSRLLELERNRKDLEALLERLTDVLADIPADLGTRAGIAARKGDLPMPLAGPVKHAFGQTRAGGLKWQGWLIGADTGAEARAIAYGRVAFADWLRGYGLMIIIDHGQGFMSLYGHNESLLRDVGAWVEPGELISIVGSNPETNQGLYFELRRDGKALDPAGWLKR